MEPWRANLDKPRSHVSLIVNWPMFIELENNNLH